MSLLLEDPWFAATLDRALAEHSVHLTDRQIRSFREKLAFVFETNPWARAVLAAARPELARRVAARGGSSAVFPLSPYLTNATGGAS